MSFSRRSIALSAAVVAVALLLVFLVLRGGQEQSAPLVEALGGATTRPDATRNAFGLPASNITGPERRIFEQGDSFFTQNWVVAPASTEARDGLGPNFNAQACASCHVLDGRGAPPKDVSDSATRGLLVRLSVPGDTPTGVPKPEPTYGDQLQDRAIDGVKPEGRVEISYSEKTERYEDGSSYSLRQPTYTFKDLAYGPMAADTMISPRIAPQVIGMGLLEAIPQEQLLANADPDDRDQDGISGRPNMVWDTLKQTKILGRFGWKSNQPTVEGQTTAAFHGDMGITSNELNKQECALSQNACESATTGGDPEIDDTRLATVVFYTRVLAVPAMRDTKVGEVKSGARQFVAMGCATCHSTTFQTGDHEVAAVANQTIHPFTDLLLHDMGPELADGRPDFDATGQEWRTAPLWGLGLADNVNGHRFLLHDGRARSVEEAILWHGGEGSTSREAFREASSSERKALVRYLESL
jgi:CxxC motif-containing protein (DUF1111 family)